MSPRSYQTPTEICARKIHYATEFEALANKRAMGKGDLWVYRCTLGEHWHLGHPSIRQITERLKHG